MLDNNHLEDRGKGSAVRFDSQRWTLGRQAKELTFFDKSIEHLNCQRSGLHHEIESQPYQNSEHFADQ